MGRTRPTLTQRVYEFERDWSKFAHAPRKVDREAFAELCAFAHFHAAPMAHSASPFIFEMILLTMVVGLVARAEELERRGVMQFYTPVSGMQAAIFAAENGFQKNVLTIMTVLRQRLATQRTELYTFARALRHQDQQTLRALLTATQANSIALPALVGVSADDALLEALVKIMRRIRQLEKQYPQDETARILDEWSRACTAR